MEGKPQVGRRVIATVKDVKGLCSAGHKPGDQMEVSGYLTGGLCGFFYHDAFPYITMLQFGGGFPDEWGGPEVVTLQCIDPVNRVTLELRRLPE